MELMNIADPFYQRIYYKFIYFLITGKLRNFIFFIFFISNYKYELKPLLTKFQNSYADTAEPPSTEEVEMRNNVFHFDKILLNKVDFKPITKKSCIQKIYKFVLKLV